MDPRGMEANQTVQKGMTEDDTFRLLKRTPFIEMCRILSNEYDTNYQLSYEEWHAKKRLLLKEHKWTTDEFSKALARG